MELLIPKIVCCITHFQIFITHSQIFDYTIPPVLLHTTDSYYTLLHIPSSHHSWLLHKNETSITHFYIFISLFHDSYYTCSYYTKTNSYYTRYVKVCNKFPLHTITQCVNVPDDITVKVLILHSVSRS